MPAVGDAVELTAVLWAAGTLHDVFGIEATLVGGGEWGNGRSTPSPSRVEEAWW